MLGLALVVLAVGWENLRSQRRRLRLRGYGPDSFSLLEKRTKTLKEEGAAAEVS